MPNNKVDIKKEFGMSEGDFANHIAAIISRAVKPVRISGLEVTTLNGKTFYSAGTQSDTYEITLRDYSADSGGKPVPETQMLKCLRSVKGISEGVAADLGDKYRRESGILSITNDQHFDFASYSFAGGREVKLFPYLYSVGYKPFEQRNMLLLERLRDISVHERFAELERDEVDFRNHIEPALDPPLLLHEKLAIFRDEVKRVIGEEGTASTAEQYAIKFLTYLERWKNQKKEDWPSGVEDRIADASGHFAAKALVEPRFLAFMQYDGYPWHAMFRSLVDTGDIREGSRMLHLGALFGERGVYEKLPGGAFMDIARAYVEKDLKLVLDDLKFGIDAFRMRRHPSRDTSPSQAEKEEIAREIDAGMYFGAIFSNLRLIAGFSHYKTSGKMERGIEAHKTQRVLTEQLYELAVRDKQAGDIIEGMSELGLISKINQHSDPPAYKSTLTDLQGQDQEAHTK